MLIMVFLIAFMDYILFINRFPWISCFNWYNLYYCMLYKIFIRHFSPRQYLGFSLAA